MQVEIWKNAITWDTFVEAHPNACNYHRWCWREVIEDTFGHKPYYLAAVENGTMVGALPLFGIQTRLFGCSLVSIPFFTYGGILTDRSDVQDELLKMAAEIAREINAKQVELRHVDERGGWPHVCSKVTMEMTLPSTPDEYLKALGSGMRKKVRYASRHSLVPQWGGIDLVPDFYDVFAANMRDLGTPVYPISFFINQIRRSPQTIRILLLREGRRAAFAAFLSSFRSKLELPWAASLAPAREKYSQLPLYWQFIEWAILNGYTKLDLGRCTPNSGPHRFKHHWNCVERALNWQYWHSPGVSAGQLRPENPKYQLAIALWKRLPLAVANTVGPRIVRGLP